MPNKKHHRVAIWVVFFVCSATVALQLLYPSDRALPLARITGEPVVWRRYDQLAEQITTSFTATKLRLTTSGGHSAEVSIASTGAEPDVEATIRRAVDYPFLQRFIPFSILFHSSDSTEADVQYTNIVLEEFSRQQAKELSRAPVNAKLAIEDSVLVATAEESGEEVNAKEVQKAIIEARPLLGATTVVPIESQVAAPAKTAEDFQAVHEAAERALSRQIVIALEGRTFMVDAATVASWLQIGADESGETILQLADDNLNSFFDTIDAQVGTPAGLTNVSLTNGRETDREPGATGRAIDRDDLRQKIAGRLLHGGDYWDIAAVLRDVPPGIIYDNKYTATEEGLQAYLDDTASKMNVRIAIQQMDGGKWSVSTRADDSIPSASTYKLFVAKWLFDQMDKGVIHWDDSMLDTNVSVCFDRMTIASTNPCALAWLDQVGRQNMNEYIYSLGFSEGTSFTRPDATHTTANDLRRMMLGIYNGTLISGAHKDRLLHSLSSHPYGYGIPTGSKGKVYDKVGFLWDYVHDTAIVYHPKGTYIMTIMTKGQSYATIASLTREIERIMYP